MATATTAQPTTTDPRQLEQMGYSIDHLQALRHRAHTPQFRLERMGFNVEVLRFYRWLVANDLNPEYAAVEHRPAAHSRLR